MCGIFGIAVSREHPMSEAQWAAALKVLFLRSESRGKEAAGIALCTRDKLVVHKDSVSAAQMLRTADYRTALAAGSSPFFGSLKDGSAPSISAIGHARLVTNGLQGIDANNQPVWRDDVVVIHNGIVVNVDDLWAKHKELQPRADVDTEVIAALFHKSRRAGASVENALASVFGEIYGETSIALFERGLEAMVLATNTGSPYVATSKAGKGVFFASERHICDELVRGPEAIAGFQGAEVRQIPAGHGAVLCLKTLELETFSLGDSLSRPGLAPMLATQRAIEEKAERYRAAQLGLRRCVKCLLPETIPFIEYDTGGVCNFCHSHKPLSHQPVEELHTTLDRFRSSTKSADCLVAFSGGRDSSYGLHLLKTEFGMNPITFSYDWGMVTDLARRNQARMCGKLGIEHIWVSANIKEKRENIRLNVSAWLKQPDLGIIPLFMAGDKHFFKYCDVVLAQTRMPLSVWCTNRLEKTDFKTGFLGIPPADVEMRNRPSSMPIFGKVNLLYQYGRRFLGNPALLNKSLPDTFGAFMSYYGRGQGQHSFLFDYLPWEEREINRVLIDEYDWETAKDTRCTWRIGDGTAPFYNYIYLTAAGFTEHDTFRSNQVREGALTRAEALAFIEEENVPRWQSIREYCQLINIDFDETVRVIDRIPKLYGR